MRLTALCGAAGLATGCGAGVSLDDPTPDSSPIGTDSSPSITSTGPGQGDGDTEGAARLDLGAASDLGVGPLPPGLCPPDCQFELSLQWAYDGPPAALPMPEDRVGMIVIDDLGFVVAEQRQGAVTLAWLDPSGLEQWTLPVPLPCDPCRRVELTRHPTGDLLLSGDGQGPTGSPIAYVARVELGTQAVRWTNTVQLANGDGVVPRTGPLIVLDDERMAIPAVQGSAFAGQERLDLLIHRTTDGTLAYIETIAQGPATGDAPVPQASLETPDVVALGRPIGGMPEPRGELEWIETVGGEVVASEPLPFFVLALEHAEDHTVALGQSLATGQATLHLHAGTQASSATWATTHALRTDSAPHPALATSQGDAYVAARIATGSLGRELDTSVQLLRWSMDGTLVWQVALPVWTDPVDHPLVLRLRDDQDLVLGAFVGGTRHVEQRRQACTCD